MQDNDIAFMRSPLRSSEKQAARAQVPGALDSALWRGKRQVRTTSTEHWA